MKQHCKKNRGQAIVELILVLPVLFFLIIFGVQTFTAIYEAQVKQEQARQHVLEGQENIYYKGNGGVSQPSQVVSEVTSKPIRTLGVPVFGLTSGEGDDISIKVGICRDIQNCGP